MKRTWTLVVLATVVSVAAVAPVGATTRSAASRSSSAPVLAYGCFRNVGGGSGSFICVSDATGAHEARLGDPTQGNNIAPRWSPDGTRIAYLCGWDRQSANTYLPTRDIVDFGPIGFTRNGGGEVCVVDAGGGAPRVLTDTDRHANAPVWSTDGSTIAYSVGVGPIVVGKNGTSPDPEPGIHLVAADGGSAPRQLTAGSGDDMPAWSPDGTRIAYSLLTGGIGIVDVASGRSVAGTRVSTGVRQLGPAWSPDGARIAFTQYDDDTRETWVVQPDGSQLQRVFTTGRLEPNVGVAYTPTWTNDSKSVLVLDVHDAQSQIVSVPVVASTQGLPRPITQVQAIKGAWGVMGPAVSPDNSTIAYTDDRVAGKKSLEHVATIPYTGGTSRLVSTSKVPQKKTAEFDPSWSPKQ
jgi:Tol biopolymer transport system component